MCDKKTGSLVAEGKSDVHANLNAGEMFKNAWWLTYCVCGGRAVGDVGNPLFGGEAKQLCEHARCEMTDVGDPFCSDVSTFLCFTTQCSFPKVEGSPTCACCNKTLAGGDNTSSWKPQLFADTVNWGDQFWLCYLLCFGESVHVPQAAGKPLLAMQRKFFCIKEGLQCVSLAEDGVYCATLSTALCCWDQCQFPKRKDSPGPVIICGKCGNQPDKGSNVAPMSYGKGA